MVWFIVLIMLLVIIALLVVVFGMAKHGMVQEEKYKAMHELGLLMLYILEEHDLNIDTVNERAQELLREPKEVPDVTRDELKDQFIEVKGLWRDLPLFNKIEFLICFPFIVIRDVLKAIQNLFRKSS